MVIARGDASSLVRQGGAGRAEHQGVILREHDRPQLPAAVWGGRRMGTCAVGRRGPAVRPVCRGEAESTSISRAVYAASATTWLGGMAEPAIEMLRKQGRFCFRS